MKTNILWLAVILAALPIAGCGKADKPHPNNALSRVSQPMQHPGGMTQPEGAAAGLGSGKVLETMNSGSYTYVKVNIAGKELWAAGPETALKVGDTISLPNGMPMQNFHSKTLNRTFETIYFVQQLLPAAGTDNPHGMAAKPATPPAAVNLEGIKKAEGGQAIEEIYKNKTSLAGQKVLVRGKVVKFNAGIMGKNWLHIQDGTGGPGGNDLTVTTQDTAAVGDTVLVRGTLATNKDFGAGYKYDVMVEEATLAKE